MTDIIELLRKSAADCEVEDRLDLSEQAAVETQAAAEIERLRGIIRSCVGGSEFVDLGNGEHWGLHMPNKHLRKLVPEALK